jgi:hypothetical protein
MEDAVERSGTAIRVRGFRSEERANYAFNLVAGARGNLSMELKYDRRRLQPAAVVRMAAHLEALLKAFAAGAGADVVAMFDLLDEVDRNLEAASARAFRNIKGKGLRGIKPTPHVVNKADGA